MQRIACCAVLTVSLLAHGTATAEEKPLVASRPLAYWVGRLTHPAPGIRRRAAEVVGREAEGFLPWEFSFDSSSIQRLGAFRAEAKPLLPQLIEVLQSLNGEAAVDEDGYDPRAAACLVIAALGIDAHPALPELKRLIRKQKVGWGSLVMSCYYAILAATPEDQPVVPLFIELLNSTSMEVPADAEEEFVNTGIALSLPIYYGALMATGHTKSEVPYLVQVAEGSYSPVIRATAVGILGQLDFDANAAVPALRRLLKDKEELVRVWAVQSLLSIEKDEKRIPEIVNALKLDRQERVEREAEMKEFVSQLKAERDEWREITVDEGFLQELVAMLNHGSGYFRRLAIQTLGNIGPAAKSAIPQLRKALNDPDEDTRRMAREALQRIQP